MKFLMAMSFLMATACCTSNPADNPRSWSDLCGCEVERVTFNQLGEEVCFCKDKK